MRNSPSGRSIGSVSIVAALTLSSAATAQSVQAIDVPAQPLTAAIIELGRETGWEIGGAIDDFGGISSNPVIGEMTPRDALEVMIAGSGLAVQQVSDTGLVVVRQAAPVADRGALVLDELTVTARRSE
ncbi:MAG: STN domain-containing protein, partial [Pseudomonadota bacterium]